MYSVKQHVCQMQGYNFTSCVFLSVSFCCFVCHHEREPILSQAIRLSRGFSPRAAVTSLDI